MDKWNRVIAFLFAVGLGIGEAVINWGNWQFAPLWVIDYLIVMTLLAGALVAERTLSKNLLLAGWSMAFGVMYMALFVTLDPGKAHVFNNNAVIQGLKGLLITVSLIGLFLSAKGLKLKEKGLSDSHGAD